MTVVSQVMRPAVTVASPGMFEDGDNPHQELPAQASSSQAYRRRARVRERACGGRGGGDVVELHRTRAAGVARWCDSREVQSTNLKAVMVKLAERQSLEVELVQHSDVLMELGGVGCLLRYATPEQPETD